MSIAIYYVVSVTLDLALRANLNIGIVTTIWAINPFTSALMDWIIYGDVLKLHHWFGMILLVICAVLISLSSLVTEEDSIESEDGKIKVLIPAYIPILMSFCMPIICTFHAAMQKYVTTDLGMSPSDFTYASFLLASICLLIASVVFFIIDEDLFTWKLWVLGFFASLTNVLGSYFATASFATGASVGPIVAMLDVQVIFLTIISAFVMQQIPHYLQLLGLLAGIVGACILAMPD
jgi:drug/metabolite transporter (DMT)-like permease